MSYASGEAAVLSILRLHADYNDKNTSRGNWKILDSGAAAHYAVLRMGAATNEAHTTTSAMTTWATEIMVYRRYIDDGPSAIALQGDCTRAIVNVTAIDHDLSRPRGHGACGGVRFVGSRAHAQHGIMSRRAAV